jgi:hypothetical protein
MADGPGGLHCALGGGKGNDNNDKDENNNDNFNAPSCKVRH